MTKVKKASETLKGLQALGDQVILKVTRQETLGVVDIILPETNLNGKAVKERSDYIKKVEVFSIGEKVKERGLLKVGNQILPLGHVFNQRIHVEKVYRDTEFKKGEEYYWCEEKEIVCKTK